MPVVQGLKVAPLVAHLGTEHRVEHSRNTVLINGLLVGVHDLNQVLPVHDRVAGQAARVGIVRVVGKPAHRVDGLLRPLLIPVVCLDLVEQLSLGHVVAAEHHPGTLDVGGLRRERQLIPWRQSCHHRLVGDHGGHREVALALVPQLTHRLQCSALLQVREGSHHQLRGLVIGLGVGNQVREVGQDRALGRLGGQCHHLVHGQVLLFLPHLLLPGDMHTGPAIGPEVLRQQLNVPGKVVVHLRIHGPIHQVMGGHSLIELADVGWANPEHRAPEGSRAQIHHAVNHLIGQGDAGIAGTIPGERRLGTATVIPFLAVIGLTWPLAEPGILNTFRAGCLPKVGCTTAQLLGER